MGIRVKELSDFEVAYILSSLVELKRVYSKNKMNDIDYNCVISLIEDLKNNKVYIGEKI